MTFSDEHLIKGCKRCDLQAQKALYEQYNARLRALVRRYVVDADDAKDVLQDAFMLIYKNIAQFKGVGSFEGWLKRIVINTALQFLKKQKKIGNSLRAEDVEAETSVEAEDGEYVVDRTDLAELTNGFDLAIHANIDEAELLAIIKTLPDDFRGVFNLFVIDQFSHAEIAALLGIDEVTSRTRLARAKKRVQAELYKRCVEKISL